MLLLPRFLYDRNLSRWGIHIRHVVLIRHGLVLASVRLHYLTRDICICSFSRGKRICVGLWWQRRRFSIGSNWLLIRDIVMGRSGYGHRSRSEMLVPLRWCWVTASYNGTMVWNRLWCGNRTKVQQVHLWTSRCCRGTVCTVRWGRHPCWGIRRPRFEVLP